VTQNCILKPTHTSTHKFPDLFRTLVNNARI
jgi:hypothetical protein